MTARQHDLGLSAPTLSFEPGVGDIEVDLIALIEGRLLVQGSSGAGKSHFLRQLCEQTCKRIPQLIFDWEGEFASLKEIHPYVLVGRQDSALTPDLDLQIDTARMVCRRLLAAGASVIVDLSELSYDDRREYVGLYLDSLMRTKVRSGPKRGLLIILDEAHEFCPQSGSVASSDAVKDLVSKGRKRGYGAVLATQRLSKVHKDIAEVQNQAFGKTILDVDVERSGDALGFKRSDRNEIKKLKKGQFFVVGPAIGDGQLALVSTLEFLQTKGIKHDDYTSPPSPAEIASALREIAEESQNVAIDADREELLERIERLESLLQAAREGNSSDPADIRRAVDQAIRPLQEEIQGLRLRSERAMVHARLILLDSGELPPVTPILEAVPEEVAENVSTEEQTLHPLEIQMYQALLSRGEMTHEDLAEATNQSVKSSVFRAHRKVLVDCGLAKYSRRGYVAPLEVANGQS